MVVNRRAAGSNYWMAPRSRYQKWDQLDLFLSMYQRFCWKCVFDPLMTLTFDSSTSKFESSVAKTIRKWHNKNQDVKNCRWSKTICLAEGIIWILMSWPFNTDSCWAISTVNSQSHKVWHHRPSSTRLTGLLPGWVHGERYHDRSGP